MISAPSEAHKLAELESRTEEMLANEASKPFGWHRGWGAHEFIQWTTVSEMLRRLQIEAGATVLDIACGAGWTTAFLAESGYRPTGVDLVPAHIELGRSRASRCGLQAEFELADMDDLDLGRQFDVVLMLDALHHTTRQTRVVANVARHLRPGGWVLFGEPSWLHAVSPDARRVSRETGWTERGVTVRKLRRDLRAAGFGTVRRFFGSTQPYESRTREFLWQLTRLVAANVAVAPQAEIWIAAQKPKFESASSPR